jgi:putative peptidoglycan lipid II flippase
VFFKHRLLGVFISATGVSLVVQVLAFFRQLLIAGAFGLGRDFDTYVVVNSVAMFAVFTFGSIFDSITVPHLVQVREKEGIAASQALARSVFRISIGLGGAASILFVIAVPLLTPLIATGFSPAQKRHLTDLAWYFLPWTTVCLPYYAAAARHKMEWRFNRVFVAEIVIVLVSIGALAIWHSNIKYLPLAYGAGYAAGLTCLVINSNLVWPLANEKKPSSRDVLRNIAELFAANQTGSLAGIVDRHMQSFVPAGGIGAINYSAQLITAIGGILSFREAFLVPLAQEHDRAAKLERLLCGLVLVALPLAGCVACFSLEIITVLFQRGHFDAAAAALTAQVLRINVFGLVFGAMFLPLLRMFQILDRIRAMHALFMTLAVSFGLFGYLFVIEFNLGVRGVAMMQVAGSITSCGVAIWLLARHGIRPAWRRVVGHFLFALISTVCAFVVATAALSTLDNIWIRLVVGGFCYVFVIAAIYVSAKSRLQGIVFGVAKELTRMPSIK